MVLITSLLFVLRHTLSDSILSCEFLYNRRVGFLRFVQAGIAEPAFSFKSRLSWYLS